MSQEYSLASSPAVAHIIESFLNPNEKVLLHFRGRGHVWIHVHRLEWSEPDNRRTLEVRGVTSDGVPYRASINFADTGQSGIVIDPVD